MSEKKQTILEWYQQQHKFIDAPCNGMGNCGRCKVRFLTSAPEPQEKEKRLLSEAERKAGIRLACVTEMSEDADFMPVGALFQAEEIVALSGIKEEETVEVREDESLGIALDIGTTTLAMALVSLSSGACIRTVTSLNRQRIYGASVLSRIQAANCGDGTELQIIILQDIWKLLEELIQTTGIQVKQLKKIAIAGNTTMCHLLLGYSCEGLGKAPFKAENMELTKLTISQLFEKIEPQIRDEELCGRLHGEVVILPGISVFVGADIVSGVYYCDMDLSEKPQMLLDIGTNGEIVIGNRGGFLVTSTAAGPVFEGGNISCGIPAVKGAIAHAKIEKCTGKSGEEPLWNCKILGDNQNMPCTPKGICGSGLIDIAASLWQEEMIDENGTLTDAYFETGVPVQKLRITQADIRELQMGKAAIRAGIEVLLEKMSFERLYLAGGFGTELDVKSAIAIGLLPQESRNCVIVKGNTSLLGLQKFLRDENGEKRVQQIVEESKEIILAEEGNFEEKYILFMQFLL